MSWRSERIESKIWISAARDSRSGAIEGRPSAEPPSASPEGNHIRNRCQYRRFSAAC
jgi:hypothetical protein